MTFEEALLFVIFVAGLFVSWTWKRENKWGKRGDEE